MAKLSAIVRRQGLPGVNGNGSDGAQTPGAGQADAGSLAGQIADGIDGLADGVNSVASGLANTIAAIPSQLANSVKPPEATRTTTTPSPSSSSSVATSSSSPLPTSDTSSANDETSSVAQTLASATLISPTALSPFSDLAASLDPGPTSTPTASFADSVIVSGTGANAVTITTRVQFGAVQTSTAAPKASPVGFFQNTPLVAGIFSAAGVVALVILFILGTWFIRRRGRDRLEDQIVDFSPNANLITSDEKGYPDSLVRSNSVSSTPMGGANVSRAQSGRTYAAPSVSGWSNRPRDMADNMSVRQPTDFAARPRYSTSQEPLPTALRPGQTRGFAGGQGFAPYPFTGTGNTGAFGNRGA